MSREHADEKAFFLFRVNMRIRAGLYGRPKNVPRNQEEKKKLLLPAKLLK